MVNWSDGKGSNTPALGYYLTPASELKNSRILQTYLNQPYELLQAEEIRVNSSLSENFVFCKNY